MAPVEVLQQPTVIERTLWVRMVNLEIYGDVTNLIVSDFVERFRILQVLDEQRDSVVVSKLVKDVGTVEGGRLYEEEEGDPLVVRVEDSLGVPVVSRPHSGVDPRLPLVCESEGVSDVAVRVEGGLADEAVCCAVSG